MPEKQVYVILNPNGLVEVLDANNVLLEEYQAVPVPPHGRCIDESVLLKGCGYIIADGMACIPVKHIAKAPTILPADDEVKE